MSALTANNVQLLLLLSIWFLICSRICMHNGLKRVTVAILNCTSVHNGLHAQPVWHANTR